MAIEVTIRWTGHPLTISREAEQRAAAAVTKAAHDIEGLAKRVVPVDTGNLKNSIQVAEDGQREAGEEHGVVAGEFHAATCSASTVSTRAAMRSGVTARWSK